MRPATAEDIEAFYGSRPATVRAFVIELEGKTIAVGGIRYERDAPFIFSDITPEMTKHRKALVKAARAGLKALARPGLCAVADPNHPGSARFLTRLGFVHAGDNEHGSIFAWVGP